MVLKKSLVYIISDINKSLAFEWASTYLNKDKYKLTFILLNPSSSTLESFLKSNAIQTYRVTYRGKRDLISAFLSVSKILRKEKADIVHAHLMDACIIGLLAAYVSGVKRRIHTRHNSTFHHLYFPRAVWYDKFINALSTDIVSISQVVTHVLEKMEGANPSKIHLIYHGFLFNDNLNISQERRAKLKDKYNLQHVQGPIVGVISRFIEWKGIQYIIPAFEQLLKKQPDAVLILANANGPYEENIRQQLSHLKETSYRIIPFEEDVFALYSLFDVFVHVPIDPYVEAFGQTYVEALSMKVPSIFTKSGIANEFIEDHKNALVVAYKDIDQIALALQTLLTDQKLALQLAVNGQEEVLEKFKLSNMIGQLEELYDLHNRK